MKNSTFVFLWATVSLLPFIGFGALTLFDVATVVLFVKMNKSFRLRRNEALFFIAFVFAASLNIATSYNMLASSINALQWVFLIFAISVFGRMVGEQKLSNVFWRGLQVSAFLATLIVSLDLFSGAILRVGGRYVFTYSSPQPLAFLFLIVALVNFLGLLSATKFNMRFRDFIVFNFLLLITAASLWVLVASASRTGLVGFAIGGFIAIIFRLIRRETFKGVTFWSVLTGVLVSTTLVYFGSALAALISNTDITLKLLERVSGTLNSDPNLNAGRLDILGFFAESVSIREFALGTGLDSYTAKFSEAKKPHNVPLLIFAEGGVFFWSLAMTLLLKWLLATIKVAKFKNAPKPDFLQVAPFVLACGTFTIMAFNTAVIQRHLWVGAILGIALLHELNAQRLGAVRTLK